MYVSLIARRARPSSLGALRLLAETLEDTTYDEEIHHYIWNCIFIIYVIIYSRLR